MAEENAEEFQLFKHMPHTVFHRLISSHLNHEDRWSLLTALHGRILRPPILLRHPLKPRNFFQEQQTVTTVSIPKPSLPSEDDPLEGTFISQLRNQRLIYCYPNGTMGLYSVQSPPDAPQYFSLLPPETKTLAIHELPDERLVIHLKDRQTFLVDLKKNKADKLNLPPVRLTSVLVLADNMIYFGLKDGTLICWDLSKNSVVQTWQFTTTSSACIPNIKLLKTPADIQSNGLAILCMALNVDDRLFMVFDVPEGYLTGLFNPEKLKFQHLQFINYGDFDKIAYKLSQIFYDRFGDLTLFYKSKICESHLDILDYNNPEPCKSPFFTTAEDVSEKEAFALPNGNLAFSRYDYNSDEEASDNTLLEIQQFEYKP